MVRRSKLLVMMLLLALAPACLNGCAASWSGLDAQAPVTLTMWHNYEGHMQQAMDALVDEFNLTAGQKQGITINVTSVFSSAELDERLTMIANGDPGAPDLPDIFTGYPRSAVQLQEQEMLANLDDHFTADELSAYVDEFIAEGRLADGGLYVFPIAKSTEVLYLNQTLFDDFAAATGADMRGLVSFEGIAELSRLYYDWTDGKTPEVRGDGKQFYSADDWFNVALVGMEQLGASLLDAAGEPALDNDTYAHIFTTLYGPAVEGGFAIYDGYSSELAKTGDVVCSTGSSAGVLYYGDSITYADGTVKEVEYSILPYPLFEGGQPLALQRGGGMMVKKSDQPTEYAAAVFIKWLTAAEQNMSFIAQTGYLPVTRQAFEADLLTLLATMEDNNIKQMLDTVLAMYYGRYDFFTAPNTSDPDAVSKGYEKDFIALLTAQRQAYPSGEAVDATEALARLK